MSKDEIERRLAKLDALEAGGVDNWEGFDDSLEEWHEENHQHECFDKFIRELNDILVDAEVDEPAGTGAGYSIEFNEDAVKNALNELIKQLKESE